MIECFIGRLAQRQSIAFTLQGSQVQILYRPHMAIFRKTFWTEHSKIKMRQYGLSKQKLLNILSKPERREKGIAPGTMAAMRTNKIFGKPKRAPGEIWIMYKDTHSTGSGQAIRKIISAWRYPGVSKPGETIPIPEDILKELLSNGN